MPVPWEPEQTDSPSLVRIFSSDDYPDEALQKSEQGTVAVNVVVRDDGRVARCDVTGSSGSASLDATTCSIIRERGNFPPLRNRMGVVKKVQTARIRWVLPDDEPQPFSEWRVATVFSVDGSGAVEKCRLESSLFSYPLGETFCASLRERAGAHLARLARYDATMSGREIVIEEGLKIGGRDAADAVGSAAGETLISHNAVSLSIDADGEVADCRATAPRNAPETAKMCELHFRSIFALLGAEVANRTVRSAVHYSATFTRRASGER